jgi:predicted nucleotide-binding protein
MAKIDQSLLKDIMKRSGLSQSAAYARIKQVADTEYLSRDLAAIKVAAEVGVTINNHATPEQLAQLRQAGTPVAPPIVASGTVVPPVRKAAGATGRKGKSKASKVNGEVFVVHGRDSAARDAMFTFLRALGLQPIEWNSAIAKSKKAAPNIGEVVAAGFAAAKAIVVLLTPDDLVKLRPELLSPSDEAYERVETGQARPNVIFEAGRAFATHPGSTVLVQLGPVKKFSDVAGLHVVHMNNEFAKRQELATKLKNAGCPVSTDGPDWVNAGDFTDPFARTPKRRGKKAKRK